MTVRETTQGQVRRTRGQLWGGIAQAAALSLVVAVSGVIVTFGQTNDAAGVGKQAASSRADRLRLLAPLSTSVANSQRPLFLWTGGRGAVTLEICRDRGCRHSLASVETTGYSARPSRALPPGVVFWRVVDPASRWFYDRHPEETSAIWELTIPVGDIERAESWGAIPDFNGDGFGDLAVGVKAAGAVVNGEMRIFPGGPQGLGTTAAQTLVGTTPGFGDESGPAGDLDGDGFGDLAVWTSGPPTSVTVYRGGPDGLGSPVTFPTPAADSGTQMRVLSAGDVNGDGYGDLLVGGRDFGAIYLGSATGVSPTPIAQLPSAWAGAGRSVDAPWPIGGGDFNGDLSSDFPDAVIAGSDGAMLFDGDGQTPVATSPPGTFYQGVGDVNGDGFSDGLALISSLFGVPEAGRVYFGGTTPCLSTACLTFAPLLVPGRVNNDQGLAAVLAGGLGDVNGDGFDEIAYGSPGAGAVYVFMGSPTGPPSTPSLTITAAQGFGFSFARL